MVAGLDGCGMWPDPVVVGWCSRSLLKRTVEAFDRPAFGTTIGGMRGHVLPTQSMFSYVSAEQRGARAMAALGYWGSSMTCCARCRVRLMGYAKCWAAVGAARTIGTPRPSSCKSSIPFAASGSLMEQLDYNLLFRWFVGLDQMDEPIWTPTVFTKNRDRLLNQEIARSFFRRVVEPARDLMSDEHFMVEGTLIEAWAGQKSFQRKDGDGPPATPHDFHGQPRSNATHASTTDPDAQAVQEDARRRSPARVFGAPLDSAPARFDRRTLATHADGTAERDAAVLMSIAMARATAGAAARSGPTSCSTKPSLWRSVAACA